MSRIAYRYAKSLLDLCIERNEVEAVSKDMAYLYEVMKESRDFSLLLQSPVVKGDMKLKVMDKIFSGHIHNTTTKFLHLMTEKGRESYLKEISESFIQQVRAHRNEVLAEVITAVPMSDDIRSAVREAAKALTSKTIDLKEKVNPELIGGFVVRVGDQQIDTSVAAQIKRLKREFSENEYIPEL